MSLTEATALWGAITGTAALILTLVAHRSDRPVLAGRVQRDMFLVSEGGVDRKKYLNLTVSNIGKRATTINTVGYKLASGMHGIMFDPRIVGPQRLLENSACDWLVEEKHVAKDSPYILYFWAKDSAGRIHKLCENGLLLPMLRQILRPQRDSKSRRD